MSLKLCHRVRVENAEGEEIYDSGIKPSHSFVKNFLLLFQQTVTHRGKITAGLLCIDGVARNTSGTGGWDDVNRPFSMYDSRAEQSEVSGIVVGSDDTPVTISDYYLGSIIVHGANPGQLYYSLGWIQTTEPVVYQTSYWARKIARRFANHTSDQSSVTVKELGVLVQHRAVDAEAVMIIRDVLDTPITLAWNEYLYVEYYIMHVMV